MANFSCAIPWALVGPPCSGTGACVYDAALGRGVCVCDAGWSGYSDFKITTSQVDCQINYVIIRVLWALLLITSLGSFFLSWPKVRLALARHQNVVALHKSRGKTYRIYDSKSLFCCLIIMCQGTPCVWALALLKLVDPEQHVGAQWAPTLLWWAVRFAVYVTVFTMQPALLRSLLKNQRTLEPIVRFNENLSVVFLLVAEFAEIVSIWPVVAAVDPFNPVPGIVALLFYGALFSLAMLGSALQAWYIERKVNQILSASHELAKNEKTLRIREKLAGVQKSVRFAMYFQALIYIFLIAFPFMWKLHDYFLPVSWQAIGPILVRVVNSLMDEEKDKNKSSQDSFEHSRPQPRQPQVGAGADQLSDAGSSGVGADPDVMHVYGIHESNAAMSEFNSARVPVSSMAGSESFESTADHAGTDGVPVSLDETNQAASDHNNNAIAVRVSPMMRMARMMTPSRRAIAGNSPSKPKPQFFSDSEG
jgi:hypothetical protein